MEQEYIKAMRDYRARAVLPLRIVEALGESMVGLEADSMKGLLLAATRDKGFLIILNELAIKYLSAIDEALSDPGTPDPLIRASAFREMLDVIAGVTGEAPLVSAIEVAVKN